MIKKYKISLFVFVALIALGFCFRQPIISKLFEFSLKGYFHFKHNVDFNAESIYKDGNHWVIKNSTLSSDDIAIFAEQMQVAVYLQDQQADVQLKNGIIFKNNEEKAYFKWKGIVGSKIEGFLEVYKDHANLKHDVLEIHFAQNQAEIQLKQVQASFTNFILNSFFPTYKNWIFKEGSLNGKIDLAFDDLLKPFGAIDFDHVILENHKLSLVTSIPKATLRLHNDLEFSIDQPLSCVMQRDETPIWELNDLVGSLRWSEYRNVQMTLCGQGCHSHYSFPLHINGKAIVGESSLKTLILNGEYAGLTAEISFDPIEDEKVNIHLSGPAEKFVALFPETLGSKLKKKLGKDALNVEAAVSRLSTGAKVQGVVDLSHSEGKNHSIFFGIILKDDDVFSMDSGWFHSEKVPLDKYVAPVIFDTDQLQLNGQADVSGVFDLTSLVLHYNALDLNLSSKYFEINCEKFAFLDINSKPAVHYFDFTTGAHGGQIPVKNARYLEKNSGLVFTDISANITLGQQSVYVTDIESYCEGIFVTGSLDVDFCHSDEGYVDVGIYPETINGNIAQVASLLSRYHSITLPQISLEGTASLKPKGGYIHFAFQQQGLQTEAYLQGTLTEIGIKLPDYKASIHDLSANFEYDHLAKILEFSDIQSTMVFETESHLEEYALAGDYIKFTDLTHGESDFDLWMGDKNRDILRIVGKTQSIDDSRIECLLDCELSHFGDVHPDHFQLILKDFTNVDFLHVEFGFKLATMLKDIQRLGRTGLLYISQPLLRKLNELKTAEGDFKVDVKYENQKALLTYLVNSQNCHIEKYAFKECLLEGKKKGSTWTIDQLKLDDISLATDFTHQDHFYDINFLGIRSGESLLIGLEGTYVPQDNLLNAKINLLEVNLGSLSEWPTLTSFVKQYQPKGELRGTGKMVVDWGKGIHIDAALTTSLKQWEINGIAFEDVPNFSVDVSTEHNVVINHFKSGIKANHQEPIRANFEIEHLDYKFSSHEFFCDAFKFNIPSQQVLWTTQLLQKTFPDFVKPGMMDAIGSVKTGHSLLGSMSFKVSSKHASGKIALPPSQYNLFGHEVSLQPVVIEFNPFETYVKTSYLFEKMPLWFSTKLPSHEFSAGAIQISLKEPQANSSDDVISILWKLDQTNAFSMQKIEGICSAIKANLDVTKDAITQHTHAIGDLTLDLSSNKLPETFRDYLSTLGINGIYSVSGKWLILPTGDLSNRLHFVGKIIGSECVIKGYACESLSCHVDGSFNKLLFKDFQLSDLAGTLTADSIVLTNDAVHRWHLDIPRLQIKNFYPSLLQRKKEAKALSDSTFAIRHFELENFSGYLFAPASFTGKGEALCMNPPKNDRLSDFWNIPSDTLANLGGNLSVLSPVAGTVEFQIKDGKFYLMKLHDMYSAGRLSKFYLPKKATEPSYVDFEGNMFMQFRIKQTSLLYKFAELFTVTVKGTIWNPTYSILKQNDND